jgi:hypothetical protein
VEPIIGDGDACAFQRSAGGWGFHQKTGNFRSKDWALNGFKQHAGIMFHSTPMILLVLYRSFLDIHFVG